MITLFFNKINKSLYPKIARKWSWSAYFAVPIFTIGNRLYWFFVVIFVSMVVNYLIYFLHLEGFIYTVVYVLSGAINLFCAMYLIIYGRILAWEKLGYQDNDKDIAKFQVKQKKIRFWSFIYYLTLTILMVIFAINNSMSGY